MIDKVTVNLYKCCKCQHKWIGEVEKGIPKFCPKCKNVRWNQRYLDEEKALFNQIALQHLIKGEGHETKILFTVCDFDYIAHNFLYGMKPQPEIFELKQVADISDIEQRHDVMLSIILDRVRNKQRYENEYFTKYSKWHQVRMKIEKYAIRDGNELYLPTHQRHRRLIIMEGCNHKENPEITDSLYGKDGSSKDWDWFRPYNRHSPYWDDGISQSKREQLRQEQEERTRLLLSKPLDELGPTQKLIRDQLEKERGIIND